MSASCGGSTIARAALPRRLIEELAELTTTAQKEWAIAQRRADFARLRPWLEKLVVLKRHEADATGWQTEPYDALLQDYEPGATAVALTRLFAALREELAPLLEGIVASPRQANAAILTRRYPLQRQRGFAQRAAAALGFDFAHGRLDSTTHPFFAAIGPGDVRITTRYALYQFGAAFFATLHEVGHGLYEQGLPAEHHGTPMAQAPSLGLHESQARLWENAVGRSRGFWRHFFPTARQMFPAALRDVGEDDFFHAVHHVAPSLNRVQADEVTYNLHIAVRFELERAMIHGELRPADLPAAWHEAYRRYLGVAPADDGEGCLQDGHWAAGMFGYFPTYTLGNVFAAQLVDARRRGARRSRRAVRPRRLRRAARLAAPARLLPGKPLRGGRADCARDRQPARAYAAGADAMPNLRRALRGWRMSVARQTADCVLCIVIPQCARDVPPPESLRGHREQPAQATFAGRGPYHVPRRLPVPGG